MKYDADGDVTLFKADTSVLYVNSAWTNQDVIDAQLGVDSGFVYGINAFADTTATLGMAESIETDGEKTITISIEDMSDASQTSEFALTSAGEYIITGGNGSKFTPIVVNGKDVTLKFDGAFVSLGKLRAGKDGNGYQKNAVGINNSVIGNSAYAGFDGSWSTFYDCTVTINNSIFGINLSKYTGVDVLELPRSAEGIKAALEKGEYTMANGDGYNGSHIGTVGFLDIDDSTVYSGFFSVADRGYADIDNSVIYVCGGMGVGDGRIKNGDDSNENGWSSTSAEDYRNDEVATIDITNSIVRNISLNGNGGGLQVGSDSKAGVLNITDSEVDFSINAEDCNKVVVYANGTINPQRFNFTCRNDQ